ncbi:MAG: ketoacyl-ACP synthase III [Acidobacteria bacterium]|nr:ketoacyl-ACP synthase III [Acidobacteriota bacterium]MCG3191194.1 3-oxoacyl-[acyl-carrier-protein] synthase 3 [Thermoanaerobaculia bacterium]MCK6685545.1 ketoacyl-ACP synthase III [Thermoanaerobaculia bacterium]
MFHAAIAGTGHAVPETVLTNEDLSRLVATSDEWIRTRTGIQERRKAKEGDVLSDYAVSAGQKAMEAAGITAKDLDAIMVATVSPDQLIPSMACFVQQKLGAKKAAAWDLNAACSGWLYGLHIGDSLLQAGKAKNVLLIGAEFLTRFTDYTDRTTCVLFGDGAGATVLKATKSDHGVLSTVVRCDGEGANTIQMPGGGSTHPPNRPQTLEQNLPYIRMMGGETFKMAVRSITEVCKEVLKESGFEASEVSWVVPHQANERIITAAAERLDIPKDRCIMNIERYGNTSSASIPIALDEAVRSGRIKKGDLILFTAFGGGFTWGAALVRW